MKLKLLSLENRRFKLSVCMLATATAAIFPLCQTSIAAQPQAIAAPAPLLYEMEWVYRIKWGFDNEFWRIFQKTQIPVLDKQKELGYIIDYQVYRPGLHTSEDSRWNYRIVIQYKNLLASTHEGEVTHQLFPDAAAYRKEDNRRWELVSAHYDLPIQQIDPHSTD